jgi:hypothetical protein
MSPFQLLSSRRSQDSTPLGPPSRTEVVPPSLRQAPQSVGHRLWFWLMAPAPLQASPPVNRLPRVRQEFLDSLADVPDKPEARTLADSIHRARSLRDLWHVRADVFRLIALHHNQQEAETRLLALNRHFPTRTPRTSAVGALT